MAQARIVRAKGLVWLSTQQSHWQQGMASLAGRRFQIKIEMDTDIEEQRFGMVEQCQKLLKLDPATEEALVKQYPQPELLLPKVEPRSKEERAARKKPPKATGAEKEALEAKFGKKKRKAKKGRA